MDCVSSGSGMPERSRLPVSNLANCFHLIGVVHECVTKLQADTAAWHNPRPVLGLIRRR